MVKVWKIEELPSFKTVNGSKVNLSDEEKNTILNEWNTEEQKKSDNKIVEILARDEQGNLTHTVWSKP